MFKKYCGGFYELKRIELPEFVGPALGVHICLDLEGCNKDILNDRDKIREVMLEAAKLAGAQIVGDIFHNFNPVGTSGAVIIAESHLAVHTWPEYGAVAIDIFTCGDLGCDKAADYLLEIFEAKNFELKIEQRLKSELPRIHKISLKN